LLAFLRLGKDVIPRALNASTDDPLYYPSKSSKISSTSFKAKTDFLLKILQIPNIRNAEILSEKFPEF